MKWKDLLVFGFQCVYIRDIVKIALLAFLGTLVGLLLPVINQQVYDKFIPMADQNGLVQICLLVLACSLGNPSFTIVKNLATFRSMNTMEYAVQSAAYDRLFNLPESFFREYDSADLAQRVMGITSIYQVFANGGYQISVRSCDDQIPAGKLAAYVCEGIGSGGGHAKKAGGRISEKLLQEKYGKVDMFDFIFEKMNSFIPG